MTSVPTEAVGSGEQSEGSIAEPTSPDAASPSEKLRPNAESATAELVGPIEPPREPPKSGFWSGAWAEFLGSSRLSKILAGLTVVGFAVGIVAWFWPDPLRNVPPVDTALITEAFAKTLDPQQTGQLIEALNSLRTQPVAETTDVPTIRRALEEAERGNTSLAKDILQQVYAASAQNQAAAKKEQAEATRHLAAITFVDNKAEALRLYREATRLAPKDLEAWLGLGDAAMLAGTKTEANEAYQRYAELAESAGDTWHIMAAKNRIGDSLVRLGLLSQAEMLYEEALQRAQARLTAKPDGGLEQRDLSISHDRIGDVRVAQGNLPGALESYEAGLAIAERLAAVDLGNAEWQRDLSISHNKIGDVRRAQGKLPRALESYEAGLAITGRLAAADPGNTEWQRDLSVSHDRIGDVRRAQGNLPGALESYETSLAIGERLAAADPGNTEWQRDLSISHNKIGAVRRAQGKLPGALESYEADLTIAERLAAADPGNAEWQRDLIVSHWKLAAAGKSPTDHYGAALTIARELQSTGRLAPVDQHFVQDLEELVRGANAE